MEAAKGQHLRENADKVDGTGSDFTIRISCQNHGGCVKCMLQLSKPVGEVARPDSMPSVQLLMLQPNYLLIYTPCGVENSKHPLQDSRLESFNVGSSGATTGKIKFTKYVLFLTFPKR